MILHILRWILTLILTVFAGKAMQKLKMSAILGWLIAGMALGPHALNLLLQKLLDTTLY